MPYVAGWNEPGFMPESPPSVFATFAEAQAWLVNELEYHRSNAADDTTYEEDFDLAIYGVQQEHGPFVSREVDGYVYWVELTDEEPDEEDEP